jgi:carboxyl-terminal processing protease
MDIGERELDHHLEWDKIRPADYILSNKTKDLDKIRSKSNARVKESKSFQLIELNAKRLKQQDDKTSYPLNYRSFKQETDSLEKVAKMFKEIGKDTTGLIVQYYPNQLISLQNDTSKFERIKNWHKQLKKDLHLHESVSILKDMIISDK